MPKHNIIAGIGYWVRALRLCPLGSCFATSQKFLISILTFYDLKRRLNTTETHENLVKAYGTSAPSIAVVKRHFGKIQRSTRRFEDTSTKVVNRNSPSKQIVAIFFRGGGVVAAIPLEHGTAVIGQWHSSICLSEVIEKLEQERKNVGVHEILLQPGSAPAYTFVRTINFL